MKLNTFYKQGGGFSPLFNPLFPCFCGERLGTIRKYFARNKLDLRIELGKYLPDYGGSLSHE